MKKPKIALFVHHPECSIQCANGVKTALGPRYEVEFFTGRKIKEQYFKKFDIIAFPGGIGDSDSWHKLLGPTSDVIKNQVSKNKKYLGICMGAYWAGPHYFDILDGVNTKQFIKRNGADVKRSYATTAYVNWMGSVEGMFFYDGCSFIGQKHKFETIATYINGDPAAIIQNNIGVIGPHPESEPSWYNKPYLEPYWHNFTHHKLLLNFVDKLMKQ